jgi:hypothetical protein
MFAIFKIVECGHSEFMVIVESINDALEFIKNEKIKRVNEFDGRGEDPLQCTYENIVIGERRNVECHFQCFCVEEIDLWIPPKN